jgi:hypothetical protein
MAQADLRVEIDALEIDASVDDYNAALQHSTQGHQS